MRIIPPKRNCVIINTGLVITGDYVRQTHACGEWKKAHLLIDHNIKYLERWAVCRSVKKIKEMNFIRNKEIPMSEDYEIITYGPIKDGDYLKCFNSHRWEAAIGGLGWMIQDIEWHCCRLKPNIAKKNKYLTRI